MTQKLYYENSHLKEFQALVLSCEETDGKWVVVLDKTAFFPEGGGQASDIGYIDSAKVLDVKETENGIIHITDSPLTVGNTVTGTIDWQRRFDFMQQHSGEHIVSGIANKLYNCENVGFHLGEDIVTLDFDKPLNKSELLNIEKLANEAVFNNVKISAYYPSSEDLQKLSYRSKKELEGDVRIVEIEGTDICACCAPHVNFTGEIGVIKLLGTESIRGGIRIELKCGMRAVDDYNEKYENTRRISALLAVKQCDTADAVDRLLGQLADLRSELSQLKRNTITAKASSFKPESEHTAVFEENLDIKELQLYSDSLYKTCDGIRGVFSGENSEFSFAICGNPQTLDSFFKKFKETFNVRGGGRNGMVQGTVFSEKSNIAEFFKNYL